MTADLSSPNLIRIWRTWPIYIDWCKNRLEDLCHWIVSSVSVSSLSRSRWDFVSKWKSCTAIRAKFFWLSLCDSNLSGSTKMSTYVYWTRAPKESTRIPEQVGRWETKLTRYPPTNVAWSDRYLTIPLHNLRLVLGLFIRRWHSRSRIRPRRDFGDDLLDADSHKTW